jgi:taurine dioxygenase
LSGEEETAMGSSISHTPIAPFGVEAQVSDLAGLTDSEKAELRRLYALEGLLVIRDQKKLSVDAQAEFCRIFGPVPRDLHDTFLVSNVEKDGIFADVEILFHHDIPYVPVPFLSGCLHALEVTSDVSGTQFASGFHAYERMPQKLRDRIDGLNALFVHPRVDTRRNRLTDSRPGDNCAVHPVVRRQKGTGRPYVFVNTNSTACLIGMSEAESDELIEVLFSYIYVEDDIYEHRWRNGDLVLWDNLALQHARARIATGVRTLQRVSVAELGYEQQYPADAIWFHDLTEGMADRTAA